VRLHEKLRQLKGDMSEGALAEAAGLPYPSVHSYCLGRRMPSFPAVVKLAAALHVDCRAFADCEDVAGAPARIDRPKAEASPATRRPRGRPRKEK
jgi:hypothetical protein